MFFVVWAGVVCLFCCLGGLLFGLVAFFVAVRVQDESPLTYRAAWLGCKGRNNQKDQTAKKKHGFPKHTSSFATGIKFHSSWA